jgi:hypothetical protein
MRPNEKDPALRKFFSYCPLCGAHSDEHGQGDVSDSDLLLWEPEIAALFDKLQEVKKGSE